MVEIDGLLYIIKERAIYAVQHADQIDPERTNIALPNIIPRPNLSEGSDSELVGKTLLTAVTMFNIRKFLPNEFDHAKALSLSFDVLKTMIAMRAGATEFKTAQQKAYARAMSASSGGSPHMPAMGDATTPCRAFMQQAYHAQGSLLAIVELFYKGITKQQKKEKNGPWDKLGEQMKDSYGENDPFTNFLAKAVPFLKGVLNIRDCLVHRDVNRVNVKHFAPQPDGQISAPTITVDFRGTRLPATPIAEFMDGVFNCMMTTFEKIIVHLCSKHYEPPAPFPIYIDMPAENRKFWKHVRFYYGSCWNGEFIPMG